MAVRHDAVKRAEASGFGAISNALGTQVLEQLFSNGTCGTVCVSPIDWSKPLIKSPIFDMLSDTCDLTTNQAWHRDAIQQLVHDCVGQFISLDESETNSTFMEAGFSSLDLVQFRQQLLTQLPSFIDLPVHFAFNYPTERDVTDYLFTQLQAKAEQPKNIKNTWTLLNGQTAGTPIFLISGVMGTIEKTFGTLAAALSTPVYAAKPAIPAVIDPAQINIESIAEELMEAMLREIPCDTYTIGGLSFGAALAFETGLQLERIKKLERIIMLDPRHMPPFIAPRDPAPFEILLEHYAPQNIIRSPVLVFQCAVPPIENQSEMMQEASRSFQDDKTVLSLCQTLCPSMQLIKNEGHHFNFLYKHVEPIADYIKQAFLTQASVKNNSCEPIAIIGTACSLPGNVRSPEEFWSMLKAGTDCITEIPSSRFDIDEVYDPNPDAVGQSYTRHGAFMNGVENFDHNFFGISMAEARAMDPQQRLLLEITYDACHDAGYDKECLRGSSTSVHIGLANDDWATMGRDHEAYNPHFGAGVSSSIVSNRISYLLGLTGPSMTIDTACSSSLVAIDLAVEKLRARICSMAIAGGVNVMLHHRMFVSACATKALSPNGRCATFDESADGYCRGEGAGAIVLKRLSDALADGDQVLAVIRGTAVNQDGRSVSLTAPNGLAQEAVIKQALGVAGLNGRDIDYVECHGTGTPLGDPIEISALKNVLGEQRIKPVVLGSVKTNIGHLEGAAGVIGLIKAIEVLRHREAPGNVHFKKLNPKIDLNGFNAIISNKSKQLGNGSDAPLVASVSSFGFGGTNAHVVLESWDASAFKQKPRIIYAPHFLPWRRLPHPCLARKDERGFVATLSMTMWHDHCIGGEVLVPAASHVTMLGGAALLNQKKSTRILGVELHDVIMSRPLIVQDDESLMHCVTNGSQWRIESTRQGINEQFASCKSMRILTNIDQIQSDIDADAICKRCQPTDVDVLYDVLSSHGVQFGAGYRNLVDLHLGETEAIARVHINHSSTEARSLTLLHPTTLDAGFQLLGLCGMKACGVCVPFNIRSVRLHTLEVQPQELWAYAQVTASSDKSVEGTVTLFSETGEVFAILEGLICRQARVDTAVNDNLFETEWVKWTPTIESKSLSQGLLLSRTPIDSSLPAGWQHAVLDEHDINALLPVLSETNWSTVALLSSGVESDVAMGLQL
ncbi:MAG: polyketide synthase dehydratase domain-containing protein, partial [Gammaproteobacteria bacterium]|nr:polyketide synthase dehydratase domain-containing protein [Gammaproteobacteria bacterium]